MTACCDRCHKPARLIHTDGRLLCEACLDQLQQTERDSDLTTWIIFGFLAAILSAMLLGIILG